MKDAEVLLKELFVWVDEIQPRKIEWILKKRTPQSVSVEEIQYILDRIEGIIKNLYSIKGEEYTRELLQKLENENGN